ncbi:MAG: arsenate reductase ArsC [Methylovirgula sp.]
MNDAMENSKPFNVLFLCPDNSARSIMAEAIMNRLYGNRFRAFSAGPQPKGWIDPYAMAALFKAGFSIEGLRSKSWDEFADAGAPELDFVFILSTKVTQDACPQWPGKPMIASWDIADPAEVDSTEVIKHLAYADNFRMLCNRIGGFGVLPAPSLDRMALQNRIQPVSKGIASAA